MCSVPWIYGRAAGKDRAHNGLVLMVVACEIYVPLVACPCAFDYQHACYVHGRPCCIGAIMCPYQGRYSLGISWSSNEDCFRQNRVLHLHVVGPRRTRKEVLELLYLMEERASHPLSHAILTAARNEGVSIPKILVVLNRTTLLGERKRGCQWC